MRKDLAAVYNAAFGAVTPVTPKQLAVAEPAECWTAALREQAFFAHSTYSS